MKARLSDTDYFLMFETIQEFQELRTAVASAPLKTFAAEEDLGKIVTFELAENGGADGIEFRFLPHDTFAWNKVTGMHVKINAWAYGHVVRGGQFITRYDGSNKITISIGEPRF